MLLIGQSLELHRPPLADALAARDAAPLLASARAHLAAGAAALDVNGGVDATADDLAWAVTALRPACAGVPLFLDTGDPLAIAGALDRVDSSVGPLVANALAAREARSPGGTALLVAAARTDAGLVIAPRGLDAGPDAGRVAEPEALAEAAREALAVARAAGVRATCYVDSLAYPPALDPARARRSLALLRLLRGSGGGVPLAAVGNVGHGAPAELRAALRVAYAAAAAGAGAAALILPVEQAPLRAAIALAAGDRAPADAAERWLAEVAAACGAGERVPPAPASRPALAAAARLLFG